MRRFHWIVVAFVASCIVALPLWFSVRGAGAQPFLAAPLGAAAGDRREGGNLRSGAGRVYVGGGRRTGK